ncbi:replication protein [Acetobacter cerevisiae]|uniref:Replication protein n=1 Tax=Acetobacter cerevisiae TaxID=178900 RepID=A0ABT1EZ92_9PROT|nr:replication protein [Acetobacter cerevisiae]MCP1247270.1 replication protein [Acetobacter cerevisiae]MCP1256810.1 replication protein [Acetobacter cerevisiae]
MTDERELDDGLAAFDQLGREMAETNRLLRAVRSDQATRNQQEQALSDEMKAALKQATGASQEALQASQTEIRSSLLWTGLMAFLIVLVAFGGGYFFGQRSGWDTGHADGYQKARNQEAAASWANTPSGQRAYGLDQLGSLDMLALCKGDGWTMERQKGGTVCFPNADARGNVTGWYLP